ncbi:MAG: hypothetical protein WA993_15465 [Candidatus Binatus sp.]|jgi:hypothetical protein
MKMVTVVTVLLALLLLIPGVPRAEDARLYGCVEKDDVECMNRMKATGYDPARAEAERRAANDGICQAEADAAAATARARDAGVPWLTTVEILERTNADPLEFAHAHIVYSDRRMTPAMAHDAILRGCEHK